MPNEGIKNLCRLSLFGDCKHVRNLLFQSNNYSGVSGVKLANSMTWKCPFYALVLIMLPYRFERQEGNGSCSIRSFDRRVR